MEVGRNDDLQTDGFLPEGVRSMGGDQTDGLDKAESSPSSSWPRLSKDQGSANRGMMSARRDTVARIRGYALRIRLSEQELASWDPVAGSVRFALNIPVQVFPIDQVVYLSTEGSDRPSRPGSPLPSVEALEPLLEDG